MSQVSGDDTQWTNALGLSVSLALMQLTLT